MKKSFRAFSIFICVILLFCGCSSLYEDNDLRGIPELKAEKESLSFKSRKITANLYFYKEETEELVAEQRNIVIEEEGKEGEAILENLLIGSFSEGLSNAAEAAFHGIEIIDDVANVYLSAKSKLNDKNKYLLSAQIADTIIDFFKVEFVCVFFDNEAINIKGYPIGALAKSDGHPMDYYENLENTYELSKASAVNIQLNTVLYFIDETGKYFLPEVRQIKMIGQFSDNIEFNRELIKSMVSELANGPASKYYLMTYVRADYLMDEKYGIKYDENGVTATRGNGIFFFRCEAERAAFYYTISGTIPVADDILIYQQFSTQTFRVSRDNAEEFAGSTITLFVPNKDANGLVSIRKIVKRSSTSDIKTYLRSLFMELNNTRYFDGIIQFKYMYVNNILISDDTVVIDFTDEFIEDFKAVESNMQKMVIYSIVNTMEQLFWTKQTLIRVNGDVPEGICGEMDFEYPFIANYGLLK